MCNSRRGDHCAGRGGARTITVTLMMLAEPDTGGWHINDTKQFIYL
jgi:hypothetical protein